VLNKFHNLAEHLRQRCRAWGICWQASDAQGVILTRHQALELLRDALGVEVELERERDHRAESLAMMIRMLCSHTCNAKTRERAMELLRSMDLQGSPLREKS